MFVLVEEKYPGIAQSRLIHEAIRRMINAMVEDVLAETARRLAETRPASVADIRALGRPVVAFSEKMAATDRTVKSFLYKRMYEHWHLNRSHSKARRVVMDLFGLLFAEPNCLPPPWRERAEAAERAARARLVADYIAGMTDRYALDEHRRLFDLWS
jgi:dGTPase